MKNLENKRFLSEILVSEIEKLQKSFKEIQQKDMYSEEDVLKMLSISEKTKEKINMIKHLNNAI